MQLSSRDELCLQICKCFQDLNNTDWQNDIVTSGTWLQGSSFPLPDLDLLHCILSLSLKPIALSPTTPCPAETWFLQPFPMGHVCGPRDLGCSLLAGCPMKMHLVIPYLLLQILNLQVNLSLPALFGELFLCFCALNCTQPSSSLCLAELCLIFSSLPSSLWFLALLSTVLASPTWVLTWQFNRAATDKRFEGT